MSARHSTPTRSNRAVAVVIALIASLLVLASPNLESKANYLSFDTSAITYNDRVCNLGDPNNHTTSDTAFEISTSEQLWEITDCVSNTATIYFELGDDIDVSDASKAGSAPTNSPIGFSTLVLAYSFSGVLDGKNRTISGLDMSADDYGVGLFAYLHNSTISNLAISGSFATTTRFTTTQNSAGGLAIRADGSLYLSSISNQANVSGKENVGGLVGYVITNANINSSNNKGAVSGTSNGFVGGLVGYVIANANITSSYNTGPVSGSDRVGGLAGRVDKDANIDSSYNTGTVSGTASYVGGLVGFVIANANINSSSNNGRVSGRFSVGGLVGRSDRDANIDSSYNTGTVSGTTGYVGGLVSYVGKVANITSSQNTGAVIGTDSVGGLVGYVINNANIDSSYNTGTASGQQYVGGLVGRVIDNANITSSYNVGPVSGSERVGGLVGRVDKDANIDSSYNTGTVSGTLGYVGGVVGYVIEQFNITSSYNAGKVTGSPIQDGLAVVKNDTVTTTSAYSSVASSYVATTPVDDMKLASTYVGFDFSSANPVWGFGACSENGGYPMLRVFGGVTTFDTTGCYTSSQTSTPAPGPTQAPTPNPVYSGPIISGAPYVVAGTEVTLTGSRLESVTTAHVGGVKVRIVSALSQSLTLDIPSSMVPGSYDLVLQSSFGTLTIQNGLTVLAPLEKVEEPVTKKLTVGSFKGYIAIYTKGYEGQRLSAKVAGKWLVISELSESWKGNSYSRTVRFTGAGKSIMVHLYIDREFVRTEELTTR